MKILDPESLKPKMILAEPVYNFQEILLLKKGTTLSEKNIRMLKSWGVTDVWIKGKSKEKTDKEVEPLYEKEKAIENELKEKFLEVLDDPVMVEIMRVAGNQLKKRIIKNDE